MEDLEEREDMVEEVVQVVDSGFKSISPAPVFLMPNLLVDKSCGIL